jgi:cytosine/adenosine deaminase-related metal-dependent hydrolase
MIMKNAGRLIAFLSILWLSWSCQSIYVFSQTQADASGHKFYKFVNGQWYDGKHFIRRTFYSVDGILTKRKPQGIPETVDLEDGFVVPPFAEAHNHNLGSAIYLNREFTQQTIQRYLAAGVFYVKIPANPADNAAMLRREFVNRQDSVDVTFANGVLTSRDGHPIGMTLDSFKQAGIAVPQVAELEGKVFFIIENEADLQAKWQQILAGKPDFIKTILRHSENFARRRTTANLFGYNGLDPQLLPRIVKQAHAAGLRVSTHIDSAADFAVAVRSGVDEINHLPGAIFEKDTNEADYLIAPEDAKRAAKQGIIVVTTASVALLFAKGDALARVQSVQRKNLQLLKQNGVRLAIGSDTFTSNSVDEAMYLKSLNVFENAELLKMWSVTAAQTIFPHRKIGHLRQGYEASFLVLKGNPLEHFERVKDIRLRFKQGFPLKAAQ